MKKNVGTTILIIFLVILVLGLGGYILYDKVIKTEKEENKTFNESNKIEEKKKLVDKIDPNRDWVYDAEYPYTNQKTDFTMNGKDFHITNIKVPYINIKGEEITKINAQIRDIFIQATAVFEQTSKGEPVIIDHCDYSSTIHDNVLSINFLYAIGGADLPIPKYYTYNIDLKTGNILSYNEVREKFGFTSGDKIEKAITTAVENQFASSKFTEPSAGYVTKSIQNYNDSISNNTLAYYIDPNKNLNIAVGIEIPASTSGRLQIITVQK